MTQDTGVEDLRAHEAAEYVPIGPKPYLDRIRLEYRLTREDLRNKVRSRKESFWIGGKAFEREYLVHESLLRSHGEFPCAGDAQAVGFCREIAGAMVSSFGITYEDAVARVNRHWSDSEPASRTPRVWIVGLDLAYHETAEGWARDIYNSHTAR
jgi:hypothetical protein